MPTAKARSQASDTEARRREADTANEFSAEDRIDLNTVSTYSAKPPPVSRVSTGQPAAEPEQIKDMGMPTVRG